MDASALATAGLEWLLDRAHTGGDALFWTGDPTDDERNPTIYSGAAGIAITLLEAFAHTGEERFADAALRTARGLVADLDGEDRSGLYFGLTGEAWALHEVAERLDAPWAEVAARQALATVRDRFDGQRWGEQFEMLGGNAGVALGALAMGDVDLAVLAVEPYLTTSEATAHGIHWEVRTGTPARFHHLSHGTLGIVHALASVAHATGRADLLDLALAGAADVVGRDEAGPAGFLVPHSDPQHKPDRIERYSYGWCHGPAGDAQTFRLLSSVTGDPAWDALVDRCWHTVTTSGLPERLRPGFWDNSGRCCGTAGVLALANDLRVEGGADAARFADVLVADLAERATVTADGACWSNVEPRDTPPELAPRTGWAMGNAGIVRELLRHARLCAGERGGYAVPWPDHPAATLAR